MTMTNKHGNDSDLVLPSLWRGFAFGVALGASALVVVGYIHLVETHGHRDPTMVPMDRVDRCRSLAQMLPLVAKDATLGA